MHKLTFELSISSDQWLHYYAGHANAVRVVADNGKSLQLPASALRPFILHNGIHGRFVVRFDQYNKLLGINRL